MRSLPSVKKSLPRVENKMKISIKANTCIYLVVLLFLLPLKWIFAWVTAILFHELCHWIAVKLCGGDVFEIIFGLGGATMHSSNMTECTRLLSILCGPIGGMLLILISRFFPELALCSVVLSFYNLLPLLPLDGGQALQIVIKSQTLFSTIEKIVIFILAIISLYLSVALKLGVLPIAVFAGLWLKYRKTPCKQMICKVQ